MSLPSQPVPVELESTWAGLAESTGLLRLEGEVLVIEFETKDGVLQVLKSGPKHHRIPLSEIEACSWKPGWFWSGGKLEVSTRNLGVLGGIPGAAQGRIALRVRHRDRDAAFGLAASVELMLAHQMLRVADAAAPPPAPGRCP